jgi:hypothetical protein
MPPSVPKLMLSFDLVRIVDGCEDTEGETEGATETDGEELIVGLADDLVLLAPLSMPPSGPKLRLPFDLLRVVDGFEEIEGETEGITDTVGDELIVGVADDLARLAPLSMPPSGPKLRLPFDLLSLTKGAEDTDGETEGGADTDGDELTVGAADDLACL